MSLQKKRFKKINESFICESCGHENPVSDQSCRNHCQHCLVSKHLDENPGDRASSCGGLMKATGFVFKGGQISKIIFICQKCGAEKYNKPSLDDSKEKIYEIMRKQ